MTLTTLSISGTFKALFKLGAKNVKLRTWGIVKIETYVISS